MHLTFVFPRLKTFSGAENFLLQLSSSAARAGHDVAVVTRQVDGSCRDLFDQRVDVRTPPAPFSWLTGIHLVDSFFDTAFAPSLVPKIPRRTDVVCFLCPPVVPAMAWLRRRSSVAIAYCCLQPPRFAYDLMHETVEANRLLGWLVPWVATPYRWMDRRLAPRCDRFFAISEHYAEWCRDLYRPKQLDLVYPGIDPDMAMEADPTVARRALDLDAQTPLVVTVNKLIPRKNIDVFLHAMRNIVDRIPHVRGVVVGDGPHREPLLELRDRLDLRDHVVFTGFVPEHHEVINYIAAADVYVFLEKNVPFGLTILEAGACGRAVVAVRGGGTADTVVDGETGFLIDDQPIDADEAAQRICQLLEDPELRVRMGHRGRENARLFASETSSARFVRILESMLETRA